MESLVLCSGGLDSVVTAFYVSNKLKRKVTLLFFDYSQNQLHAEREAVRSFAKELGVELIEVKLDLPSLGKGDKERVTLADLKNTKSKSAQWYVPCRNGIFLAYALGLAEKEFVSNGKKMDIFVGFKSEGRDHYPDTTQEFIDRMNQLAKTMCSYPIMIKAPMIKKDKEDIVLLGEKLGASLEKTHSCYSKQKKHCGVCLACRLRQESFYWANVRDETYYKHKPEDFRLVQKSFKL